MTQIFKDYSDFQNREDKSINGVSIQFSERYENWKETNQTNEGCWNCSYCSRCSGCSDCSRCSDCSGCSYCSDCSDCSRCSDCSGCSYCSRCSDCSDCSYCSDCSGCSYCSDCSGCSYCSRCSDCSDCSRCSDCSGCSYCSDCSDCSGCSYCSDCSDLKSDLPAFDVPVIQKIHSAILSAVDNPNALDMSTWHTCDTTHCRAGWVVFLAGEKGKELEEKTSTLFAAMQIYHKSSPEIKVSPTRFYEKNEIAMADIKRCADLEKTFNKNNH